MLRFTLLTSAKQARVVFSASRFPKHRLWCKRQGVRDHLVTQAKDNAKTDKGEWVKIDDAQLCSPSWKSIDSNLIPLFRPFQRFLLNSMF